MLLSAVTVYCYYLLSLVPFVACIPLYIERYASYKLEQNIQVFRTDASSRPIAALTHTVATPTKEQQQADRLTL
jgi:hypothetical protein